MPNSRNIPTSTLQSNIWYHLGLAHYLSGSFEDALQAYRKCWAVSGSDDMKVATAHWLYMCLRRLDHDKESEKVLELLDQDLIMMVQQTPLVFSMLILLMLTTQPTIRFRFGFILLLISIKRLLINIQLLMIAKWDYI